MPSSYTSSLRLTLPATGELSGTWGDTVNNGITTLLDNSVAGTVTISHPDTANYTLTTGNGTTDEARYMFLNITGTLTAARNVVCPNASKLYFVRNNTTGGFAVTVKTASGTGISVPNGAYVALYCDATNVVYAFNSLGTLDALSLNGTLTLQGGTGNQAIANGTISGSTGTVRGFTSAIGADATASTSALAHFTALSAAFTAGASITNQYGFLVGSALTGGTTNLGFSVSNIGGASATTGKTMYAYHSTVATATGGGTAYNLYLSGTAPNYLNGDLGVGVVSPSYKVDVLGSATESARFRTSGSINAFYLADSGTTAGSLYIGTAGNDFRIVTGSNERVRVDSAGNLGVATTPSAWGASFRAVEIGGAGSSLFASSGTAIQTYLTANTYFNGTSWIYKTTGAAARYDMLATGHQWNIAASGTAGTAITFTQAMALDASGNLLLGTASNAGSVRAIVDGTGGTTIRVTDNTNTTFRGFGIGNTSTDATEYASFKLNANSGEGRTTIGNSTYGGFYTLYTNGAERFRVDLNGNMQVGGTTTRSVANYRFLSVLGSSGSYTDYYAGTTLIGNVGAESTLFGVTAVGATIPLTFWVNSSERVRITTSGNVGINNTNPGGRLQINTGDGFLFNVSGVQSSIRFGSAASTEGTAEWLYDRSTGDTSLNVGSTGSALVTFLKFAAADGSITSPNVAAAVGYKGIPQNSQTASYTLALSDIGKHISITTGGVVIPANGSVAFPIGSSISVFNNSASTQTISITTDTLRLAGGSTTGTRTLAAYGVATLMKVASTVWVATGNVT